MMTRLFPLLYLFLACQWATAQAPRVTAHFPANLEVSAAQQGAITIDFDTPLEEASVHSGTVKVFGRWSGPLAATVQLANGGQRIEVVPTEPFIAGEWVTVNLTRGIRSAAGEAMGRGYIWNFWVAAAVGSLQQSPVDTIILRLPEEDYLQTYGAYAGDIDNDGFSDLVVVNEHTDDLRILLNDG
ncbi:MAG: Ig-like domain-containing protein, partial [Phaeodactylibacter sp.]|nr:Ig-like domain-containing protein [Phaeodactylibacter sp.]